MLTQGMYIDPVTGEYVAAAQPLPVSTDRKMTTSTNGKNTVCPILIAPPFL
jgi:hypothetical protein